MRKTKLPRSDYFLASYTAIVCCLGAALVWLRAPHQLLILLMGPIIFAAFHYARCVYRLMLVVTAAVSFWVLTQIPVNFSESLRSLVTIALTVLIIAEMLHRLIGARTRVETALRESEERFRTVVEHLGEGLLITDLDDTVLYVNSRLARLSGYTTQEMIGQPAYRLFLAQQDWPNLHERNKQRRQGTSERYEVRIHRKDGGHFWAEVQATPFRAITGEIIGTLGAVTDITEHKHAQRLSAAFSALGQQLSSAMTAEAAARIIANVADEILGWDAFLLDLYMADEDAIYPVLMIDLIDGRRTERSSSPFDHAPNRITRRTLRAGAQLLLERDPLDTTHWIPFGNPEHVSASLMLVPIRSGANTVGILSIQSYTSQAYTDADLQTLQALADHCGGALERTQAAEKLRENEARYRTISELTSDYVFAMRITPDGNAVTEWVTGAFSRITGYTLEEFDVLGGWKALVYPDDLPIYLRGQASAIDRPHEIEYRIQTKQGQIRWLRVYVRPAPALEQEQTVHLIGAVQDVTERKRAEEAMLHAQKLESLGVLAGGIAHDFNNLLMAILGNAGLALLELPPNTGANASIKQIEIAAQRAADLTHQMLAYSGKGRFVVQKLDLNTIVTEMTDLLKASIAKNALLNCKLARELPLIEADATQIRQVLMNLIVNASDAISDLPGSIHVTTGVMQAERAYLADTYLAPDLPAGVYAYIEVADTGCGMDTETLARIFDPFFTTKFTGRGLGLAAVLGIVRGHQGALKVESAPGRGTTFRVLFPCVAAPSQPLLVAGAVQFEQHSRGKVLIVDDEEVVRAVAKRMLERFGFAVLTAPDGHSGVETFRANADDIACTLLDMTMPHLNGEEAFRAIQRIKPDARVVLISGYNEQDMISRFGNAGPAGFLQKPFTPADLREKVQAALGAR